LADGQVKVVGRAGSVDEAVEMMAACVRSGGNVLRVAVGVADQQAAPLADALEAAVVRAPNVIEVVRYRVGPSVGAHTGPGTVGAFWF
jgi:fatty acid-binding protein DegV